MKMKNNNKAFILVGFIFLFMFYFSIILIGVIYGFKLAFLLFVAFISYQGFVFVKDKIKRYKNEN